MTPMKLIPSCICVVGIFAFVQERAKACITGTEMKHQAGDQALCKVEKHQNVISKASPMIRIEFDQAMKIRFQHWADWHGALRA